jgi:tRNA A37 threonylcarbamoyladenosine dehydratase
LARNGVGQIALIDGDVFEESNLNRQILATLDTLKRNKAEIAAKRVQDLNPAVSTNVFSVFADRTNLANILRHVPDSPCQVIIDAADSIPAKLMLADCCSRMNIPMIHGALAGSYWNKPAIHRP